MTPDTLVGARILLLLAVFGGRVLTERALGQLDVMQKAAFLDAFSNQRRYSVLIVIALIVLLFLFPGRLAPLGVSAILIGYVAAGGIYSVRKMQQLQLPTPYIRSHVAAHSLQLAAIVAYLGVLEVTGSNW